MKFLLPNYSCLQNSWVGGYLPQIPVLCPLSSTEFFESLPPNKIPGYATDSVEIFSAYTKEVNLKVLYLSIYFTNLSVSGLMYAQEISA